MSIRSIVWSVIEGSKTAYRRDASDLARTIAISASRSSSPGVARPGRPTAMPSDALMNQSRPPIGNGARSSWPMRSAIRRASSTSTIGSRMIPNSSPPKRATVSLGRSVPTSRWPTAARSRSPTAWPTLSLMTLNRSRSSRMTATGSASVRLGRQGVRDPVGQELAVREAGGRVVEGAALGRVEQPGVVERDRGELGEADQGVGLARSERAIGRARGEADDPDRRPARGQRHAEDGPERGGRQVRRAVAERVVVVDRERRARAVDLAAEALVDRHPVPEEVAEQAAAVADHERPLVGLDEVDEAVRRAEQGGRAGQDRLEQHGRVVPVEERERGLVERAQVRIVVALPGQRGATLRLGEVQRPVGHLDQRVLGRAVVRVAGDADADRHVRAAGRPGQLGDAATDPVGDLVGGRPVGVGEDDGELVAAVAVQAVAGPGGPRRARPRPRRGARHRPGGRRRR